MNTDDDHDVKEKWKEVDKSNPHEVRDFMTEQMGWNNIYDVIYVEKVRRVNEDTGGISDKKSM